MYERILVPTDGSKGATRGVNHALNLAEQYGAAFHTMYVVDEDIYGETPAMSSEELFIEQIQTNGEELLEQVVSKAGTRGIETTTECIRGTPHKEIVSYAEANNIDLIVMGKHGLTGNGKPHFGSTTGRVLRFSDIPVLSV
ncbi:universal stress protein [Haladaptatus sp. DFWS20]|uniref:universal stress protein n=1 Tax=Haladaptatus sp. DFWS20 TaxID=3403467 RepID=UPI003EC0FE3A